MLLLIVTLLVSIVVIYFIWRSKFFSNSLGKAKAHLPRDDRSGDIIPFNKRHKPEPMAKTFEEAEKRSWQFFYDLADKIKKIFSKDDTKQMYALGKALLISGLEYVHVIVFDADAARQAARVKQPVSPDTREESKDIKR